MVKRDDEYQCSTKTEFNYANTSQMDNGIFYGKTDDGVYEIFNKKLGKIFEGKLSYIKQHKRNISKNFAVIGNVKMKNGSRNSYTRNARAVKVGRNQRKWMCIVF